MNTKNNKRRKESQNRIEKAFVHLIQEKQLHEITVTDICKSAEVNRTTFYANYLDIFDLVDKIGEKMINDFHALYEDEEKNAYNSNDFLKLFTHIKENQLFYKTYFKLGLDTHFEPVSYDTKLAEQYYQGKHIKYHMEYFRAGITALIKMWLENGCDLSPEEFSEIIIEEYKNKH